MTPETVISQKVSSEMVLTFAGGNVITSGQTFDKLSKYYGDLSYNRYSVTGPRIEINDSISKIKVITVNDFDASHPTGSDLSETAECR